MIECVFTIDYELYGNGEGSLLGLVYEPEERLRAIFRARGARFVTFVEVAELEMIEAAGTDAAIDLVKRQVRDFHQEGFELGLHLHPQWYNGRYESRRWLLDYSEYNLCTLPTKRIAQIVSRSVEYLQRTLNVTGFVPLSFRAGNWLFQPTLTVAEVLAEHGVKVDTSVFKGGLQREHKLDYRRALDNGHYWRFTNDINVPDARGALLELPIYTQMVPAWKMLTGKRVGLQKKGSSEGQNGNGKLDRLRDFLRFRYPLKLDFCRMKINELTRMIDLVVDEDQRDATSFRPVVAIGHTKDLVDFETVESLLVYLEKKRIRVSTFKEVHEKCH
jgi:hypothetical protein